MSALMSQSHCLWLSKLPFLVLCKKRKKKYAVSTIKHYEQKTTGMLLSPPIWLQMSWDYLKFTQIQDNKPTKASEDL